MKNIDENEISNKKQRIEIDIKIFVETTNVMKSSVFLKKKHDYDKNQFRFDFSFDDVYQLNKIN